MRKILRASGMVLALALAGPLSAQPAQSIEGEWVGQAVLKGQAVDVRLAFDRIDGKTVGKVALRGLPGEQELFIVHYDAPIVHAETSANVATVVFDAEQVGSRMRGWIERDGERAPIEMVRKDRANIRGN